MTAAAVALVELLDIAGVEQVHPAPEVRPARPHQLMERRPADSAGVGIRAVVEQDLIDGYVSRESARNVYGLEESS